MHRIVGAAQSLLRLIAGLLFFSHGATKLMGWSGLVPSAGGAGLSPLLVAAGLIEFFGGAAISIGLLTRPVAFICAGEMAVAYFRSHYPRGFWPAQNQGELAVLYCFMFLFFSVAGPGPLSLDNLIKRRRPTART